MRLADNDAPDHLESAHRELWAAACNLLQENSSLTSLSNFTFHIASNDATWQNSPHATRERQP